MQRGLRRLMAPERPMTRDQKGRLDRQIRESYHLFQARKTAGEAGSNFVTEAPEVTSSPNPAPARSGDHLDRDPHKAKPPPELGCRARGADPCADAVDQ